MNGKIFWLGRDDNQVRRRHGIDRHRAQRGRAVQQHIVIAVQTVQGIAQDALVILPDSQEALCQGHL
jgi:hypothetical protein